MPAPTALLRRPQDLAEAAATPLPQDDDEEILVDASDTAHLPSTSPSTTLPEPSQPPPTQDGPQQPDTEMSIDEEGRPSFPPSSTAPTKSPIETRKVPIPPHRLTPLKAAWPKIYPPLVQHLTLQVRMNLRKRCVELRSTPSTPTTSLQKGVDFLTAFALGFDVDDAIALLRLDDLYIETFEIKDVKTLQGEHLGRAIGRIAGKDGKTKFAIENASKTRVVLADQKVHILGGFRNIHVAREAVVSLILGAPPGKVYGNLRTVAGRMKGRF